MSQCVNWTKTKDKIIFLVVWKYHWPATARSTLALSSTMYLNTKGINLMREIGRRETISYIPCCSEKEEGAKQFDNNGDGHGPLESFEISFDSSEIDGWRSRSRAIWTDRVGRAHGKVANYTRGCRVVKQFSGDTSHGSCSCRKCFLENFRNLQKKNINPN